MAVPYIPYKATQILPKLLQEVMDQNPALDRFYTAPAILKNFDAQMALKTAEFSTEKREILAECLSVQYKNLNQGASVIANIEALRKKQTFTVTTGHQLNLMGGPLYFLYKIISVINLAKTLKKEHPKHTFIPVFWMASEDHDFDEINHFYFGKDQLEWQQPAQGAVGRYSTTHLSDVLDVFETHLGSNPHADSLKELFQKAYIQQHNLADATRALVHHFFGENGLVVIDGDDAQLKQLFVPSVQNELSHQWVYNEVTNTNGALKTIDQGYKIQVNPRVLNLFYIKNDLRARIEENEGVFRILNTDLSWGLEGILEEVKSHPERFSPNVLMRPLYQETILPNLCYVGGGGELSYWLQLKSCFERFGVTFPLMMHRNSVLLISEKQHQNLEKLNLTVADLFLSPDDLTKKITLNQTQLPVDFSEQKNHLKKQFEQLYALAKQTDGSFLGAVAAQEKKQLKGLSNLEKRLLKAEKRTYKDHINRALLLQSTFFPNGNLQERVLNFSTFYALYGDDFVDKLKSELDPFQQGFAVISL
jgi:bacillithiol synthase